MEQVKEFLEALRKNPQATELLNVEKPEKEEDLLPIYEKVAAALGFSLSAEQIKEGIAAMAKDLSAKAEQVKKEIDELSSKELENVSGGTDIPHKNNCKYSFEHQENCWFMDGCDQNFIDYSNYVCKSNEQGW